MLEPDPFVEPNCEAIGSSYKLMVSRRIVLFFQSFTCKVKTILRVMEGLCYACYYESLLAGVLNYYMWDLRKDLFLSHTLMLIVLVMLQQISPLVDVL